MIRCEAPAQIMIEGIGKWYDLLTIECEDERIIAVLKTAFHQRVERISPSKLRIPVEESVRP